MLHSIPGSRGEGSQINKVVTTQSPPNRSGRMLMVKSSNTVHSGYASYLRGTQTAKVEGMWLSRDPKTLKLVS